MECAMIGETSLLEIIAMVTMTKNKNDTASCRIREVKTNPFSKRQIASVSKAVIAAPPIPAAPPIIASAQSGLPSGPPYKQNIPTGKAARSSSISGTDARDLIISRNSFITTLAFTDIDPYRNHVEHRSVYYHILSADQQFFCRSTKRHKLQKSYSAPDFHRCLE